MAIRIKVCGVTLPAQLGAFDETSQIWRAIKSSLLLILNEKGFVLGFRIVPNDKRTFVTEILVEIWKTKNR